MASSTMAPAVELAPAPREAGEHIVAFSSLAAAQDGKLGRLRVAIKNLKRHRFVET